jgi:hypothetical protein
VDFRRRGCRTPCVIREKEIKSAFLRSRKQALAAGGTHFSVAAEDGGNYILAEPISDECLADYKAHSEAFFGAIQRVEKPTMSTNSSSSSKDGYKAAPKEKLLELMCGAPDIEVLRQIHCGRCKQYRRAISVTPNGGGQLCAALLIDLETDQGLTGHA